jgi:hypothetical protein
MSTMRTGYSEAEVAKELGLTIEELRALVRRHVPGCEEELAAAPVTTYRPTDLLLLRILLANSQTTEAGDGANGGPSGV